MIEEDFYTAVQKMLLSKQRREVARLQVSDDVGPVRRLVLAIDLRDPAEETFPPVLFFIKAFRNFHVSLFGMDTTCFKIFHVEASLWFGIRSSHNVS